MRKRNTRGNKRTTHKDVEYAVSDQYFKSLGAAAAFAVRLGLAGHARVDLDVLVYSRSGARWVGGDDAVKQYDEDPDASVFERLEIRVAAQGRVP